jgi:hypothetical protein
VRSSIDIVTPMTGLAGNEPDGHIGAQATRAALLFARIDYHGLLSGRLGVVILARLSAHWDKASFFSVVQWCL